jgi:trans-aconitate methyltransferase
MSDKILGQYASSATLSTRRGLYDTNVGISLTERLEEQLQLATAESLLDAGCGYGADIANFASRHPHLRAVGFDLSEGQINDAKIKTPSAEFFVGDVMTFQLEQIHDRILMRHVLHLVPDPSAAINNILKHLKPGGRAVFAIHSQKTQPRFTGWRTWFKDHTGIGYSAPSDKLTIENNRDLFSRFNGKVEFIEAAEMISLVEAEPYLAYIKGQKRWSREPSADELELLLTHVRTEIENEIQNTGRFEDPSINGIVVLSR